MKTLVKMACFKKTLELPQPKRLIKLCFLRILITVCIHIFLDHKIKKSTNRSSSKDLYSGVS